MSNETFKIKNGLTLTPVDLTSLTNPQAGDLACDINDLNKIKRYDANSLGWTEVGSGGVGNVNALLTQTFDTAALAQFTQTGLALTTSNPIDGTQSARLIHQAASSQSFKQVIAVDRKYRGDLMAMSLQVRSSATSGNLTLLVTDETNSAVIMASSSISTGQYQVATAVTNATTTISGFSNVDINLLKVGMTITGAGIPTATVISSINTAANTIVISQAATASATITAKFSALPDRKSFSFTIPTNCASLSYTITALQEAGLPESYVDDVVIELANVSLLETSVTVPNLTAWQAYTPTFTSFGTPTSVEFQWRQVGGNVEIKGKFTNGISTVVESRISLPNGLTSAGVGIIPSLQEVGKGNSGGSSTTDFSGVSVLIEPSVTYMTFGREASTVAGVTKQTGNTFPASLPIMLFASVPCAGLSASSSTSIPLTQSGLVQEADSMIRLTTGNGYGSAATSTRRFLTVSQNIGSDIQYVDSPTLGGRFTALTSGVYNISFCDSTITPADASFNILINGIVIAQGRIGGEAGEYTDSISASPLLNAGDVITLANGATPAYNPETYVVISKQGSLKQVSVNTNSKITIPTSELRFEGASTRGSTDTAIVKFDTQAKIRGDAFSVVNTAANGTVITMLKAGRLDVSTNITSTSAGSAFRLTKNQATLTALSNAASEILASEYTSGASDGFSLSWSGFVSVGDIIRITGNASPIADNSNALNLSFQEQEIQVSVSNTLPQFSESDSCVRLSGANGFGSSATSTRRFASTIQNIGTDIEYIDSPTLGGQFIAKAAGIYHVSYSEESTTSTTESLIAIAVNGSNVAFDNQALNTASANSKRFSASWSGYLSVGDIVSCSTLNANGAGAIFTISKVGKPNVTGVNVTPFVNVPQPVSQHSFMDITQTVGTSATVTGALNRNTANGIFSYNSSTGVYTALKTGNYTISAMLQVGVTQVQATIFLDGVDVARQFENGAVTGGASCSYAGIVSAGSTFYVTNSSGAGSSSRQVISVLATATSDTILTAPETFSTDTASLQYASSSTYTLSTLANAPVGTFITYTYALNTNTRTQTTTAPTQTTADMNANGMLIYTRPFNAASTAAQPTVIAVQIGKGLKGKNLELYKSAGKATSVSFDCTYGAIKIGIGYKEYNEVTGILLIDAGVDALGASTNAFFTCTDLTNQTSGYLVVNASKNPALTGLGVDRVAARGVNSAGTSINNLATPVTLTYNSVKEFDTHNALNTATGVFTCPVTGYYQVSGSILYTATTWAAGNIAELALYKNGTFQDSLGRYTQNAAITQYVNVAGSKLIYLNKGEAISMVVTNNRTAGASALEATFQYNNFSIAKISGIN
jgi:hypothetical protein